jgi:hypothetical protein
VDYTYHLASSIERALTWPEIYGAATIGALIFLISIAMFVAMFSRDDKRAKRAHEIFSELLKVFPWRTR